MHDSLPILLSELPTREEIPSVPPIPTKSEKYWVVNDESDESPSDCDLRACFAQARGELGFDRHEDVFFRKGTSAISHAERVLTLYSERVGGTITSEIQNQLLAELECGGLDPLTLEWRVVGEPTFTETGYLPNFVRLCRNYEVRASGFREESIVVDGNVYTRKVEVQTGWHPAGQHKFHLWVDTRRVSLED